jgi:hypothetical protein
MNRAYPEPAARPTASTSLQMDVEALEHLFTAGEPPLLRVTVTVQDNN